MNKTKVVISGNGRR